MTWKAAAAWIGSIGSLVACGSDAADRPQSTGSAGTGGTNTASMAGMTMNVAGTSIAGMSSGGAATTFGGSPSAAGSHAAGSDQNAGGVAVGGSGGTSVAGASTGGQAAMDGATWVPDPSWACGMPDGLVPPTQGELVLTVSLDLGETHEVGTTQYGQRRLLDVTGGTVTGDKLKANVLTGGLELELRLANGSIELEQLHMLRASDNTLIYLRSCGLAPDAASTLRFVPDFEVATSSSLAWLNTGKFVGTRSVDADAKKVTLKVYDVSKVVAGQPRTTLKDPTGVANQPWDCSTMTGAKGDMVFTESVGIGSSLAVGASKRGTRNVIPITGGNVTGRVTGKVLPGGADFQITSGTAKLDARYTLATNDGEFILVRNCGAFGALVPQFETRTAGPYAFLNANTFVSSDPGSAAGGVSITMYERK